MTRISTQIELNKKASQKICILCRERDEAITCLTASIQRYNSMQEFST